MVILSLVAAAGALALTLQNPVPQTEVDPIIGGPVMSSDPAKWHAHVRAERRDTNWAPLMEETLRQRFASVAHVGGPNNTLRVICATSTCEAAGTINAPPVKSETYNPDAPLNVSMRELQGKALHDDLLKAGLSEESAFFTSTTSKPDRTAFFIYFTRKTR